MTKRNQHITPHRDGWQVRGAGSEKATSVHSTQAEAISHGRDISRNQGSELLIHGRNGRIRARDSHGSDPYPPNG
ncbi:DUF2188 domain-containing protein [Paremcibacter congregatus]|uniref:DUF2188 domain-containing protein n=1 Tax=Paremcibacter congregatus TaxID=2043170 RepID=A0A2G4YQZ5_9PROT|nr:DUF2188 domain-containing protein [Paremcibacter congregatus]PHZ84717.1 hypothetical protein CRD36_10550 [Paremcibacter congregatus]QDE28912.1 DUF2188 domain-containing protein [Paremcibacter congregatus]